MKYIYTNGDGSWRKLDQDNPTEMYIRVQRTVIASASEIRLSRDGHEILDRRHLQNLIDNAG